MIVCLVSTFALAWEQDVPPSLHTKHLKSTKQTSIQGQISTDFIDKTWLDYSLG